MKPIVYAHRGASGYAPENTIAAFKKAVELGAGGIELDVQITTDGHVVVIHDTTVDRTSDGTGNVKEMTLAQIRSLDAGSWFSSEYAGEKIPTLEEVMEFLKDKDILLNIEIKPTPVYNHGVEEKVEELIRKYKMKDQIIISGFCHRNLEAIKAIDPELKTGLLYTALLSETGWYAYMVGAKAVHPNYNYLDEIVFKQCREYGIQINTWTVNKREDMEKLVKAGVDGIITNYPDIALEVVKQG